MQHQQFRHAHNAFSLIELLVVIAIIALLISILLPALASARDQARRVVCASNIHQYTLGLKMYADDNKSETPLHIFRLNFAPSVVVAEIDPTYTLYRTPTSTFGTTYWDLRVLMADYLPGLGVLTCPGATATGISDPANVRGMHGTDGPATYCSYYYFGSRGEVRKKNTLVIRDRFPDFGLPTGVPGRTDQIDFPALMPLAQDCTSYNTALPAPFSFMHGRGVSGGGESNPSGFRRASAQASDIRGTNIGFYDGHVAFFTLRELDIVGLEQRVTESVILSRLPMRAHQSLFVPADLVVPGLSRAGLNID